MAEVGAGPDIRSFADRLGTPDLAPALLEQALRHRSWCAEHDVAASNERLEFLGDAVLDLIVTDELYAAHPELPEGQLAKIRAAVVSADALALVAETLDLGDALLLGRGEDASGGRTKRSLLADALEAVIGAVYLDRGYDVARTVVLRLLAEPLVEAARQPGETDYKTRLQEYAARVELVPAYDVRGEGPDHAKTFFAVVTVNGHVTGEGQGRSKKQAEQAAARDAWTKLPGERE